MNIGELRNKIAYWPADMEIIIVPSDDDREESQFPMTKDMWNRKRVSPNQNVAFISFPFNMIENDEPKNINLNNDDFGADDYRYEGLNELELSNETGNDRKVVLNLIDYKPNIELQVFTFGSVQGEYFNLSLNQAEKLHHWLSETLKQWDI